MVMALHVKALSSQLIRPVGVTKTKPPPPRVKEVLPLSPSLEKESIPFPVGISKEIAEKLTVDAMRIEWAAKRVVFHAETGFAPFCLYYMIKRVPRRVTSTTTNPDRRDNDTKKFVYRIVPSAQTEVNGFTAFMCKKKKDNLSEILDLLELNVDIFGCSCAACKRREKKMRTMEDSVKKTVFQFPLEKMTAFCNCVMARNLKLVVGETRSDRRQKDSWEIYRVCPEHACLTEEGRLIHCSMCENQEFPGWVPYDWRANRKIVCRCETIEEMVKQARYEICRCGFDPKDNSGVRRYWQMVHPDDA